MRRTGFVIRSFVVDHEKIAPQRWKILLSVLSDCVRMVINRSANTDNLEVYGEQKGHELHFFLNGDPVYFLSIAKEIDSRVREHFAEMRHYLDHGDVELDGNGRFTSISGATQDRLSEFQVIQDVEFPANALVGSRAYEKVLAESPSLDRLLDGPWYVRLSEDDDQFWYPDGVKGS